VQLSMLNHSKRWCRPWMCDETAISNGKCILDVYDKVLIYQSSYWSVCSLFLHAYL